MANFVRVLRLVARQRLTLACIFSSSLIVAFLWGANLGTVYPMVQIVFQGKTIVEGIEERRLAAEEKVKALADRVQALEEEHKKPVARSVHKIEADLSAEMAKLAHAQWTLSWLRWAKDRAVVWLPKDAWGTIVGIVLFLIAATALKEVFLVANLMLVDRVTQLTSFNLRRIFYRKALRMDMAAFGEEGRANSLAASRTTSIKSAPA